MHHLRRPISATLRTALVVVAIAGCAAGHTPGDGPAAPPSETTTVHPPEAMELSEAIRAWEAAAGDHFGESARALEGISEAAAAGDESAVRAGCDLLHDTNAVGLQRHLPTPDPALTAELQRMIDDMNSAAHACARFANGRDLTDADVYQDYLGRAVGHLNVAKTILDRDRGAR